MINLSKNDVPNIYILKNQLNPPPDELDIESGMSMWIIKDIQIWAVTYENALVMYNEIISWKNEEYETTI